MRVISRVSSAMLLWAFSFVPGVHGQMQMQSEQTRAAVRTALQEHRYADAIHILEEALKVAPKDANLKTELGKACLYDHQDDRAIQIFREVLQDNPSNTIAKLELARALGYRHQYDDSNQLYRELRDTKSGEMAEIGLVRNLVHQGKKAQASGEVKAALARYPNSAKLQQYAQQLESQQATRQREPRHPVWEPQGEILGSVSYLSDSAGNRSLRSTQQFDRTLTSLLSTKVHLEERSLWQTATPRANLLWLANELQFHPGRVVTVSAGGGLVRFADGSTRGLYVGGLNVHPSRTLSLSIGFTRNPVAPTFQAAQFDLISNGWNMQLAWNPRGWQTYAYGMTQHYSDSNRAKRAGGEFVRWIGSRHFSVGVGYQFRYISFSQRLFHGYFEPSDYKSHLGVVGIKYRIGKTFRAEYTGRAGGESISGAAFQNAWEVSLRHHVEFKHWDLGGDYSYFRLAQNTAAYDSQMGRFLVAYHF